MLLLSHLYPAPGRPRVAPEDAEIRRIMAHTPRPTVKDLSERWGVQPQAVYLRLREAGVSLRARGPAQGVLPFPEMRRSRDLPETLAIPDEHGQPALCEPLPAEDLARAFELARTTGMNGRDAITWVRADKSIARSERLRGRV
ncbi:hypothetical protein ACRAWG_32540 [Methylobacterium sp. P31]